MKHYIRYTKRLLAYAVIAPLLIWQFNAVAQEEAASSSGIAKPTLPRVAYDEGVIEEVVVKGRFVSASQQVVNERLNDSSVTDMLDADTIARGRELYLDATGANCSACHGEGGRGDGPSARAFLDHWGYPLVPRDLTSGVYRAGSTRAALYGSIATGINGTPMPSFAGSIAPEDIWAMVHFIESLRVAR